MVLHLGAGLEQLHFGCTLGHEGDFCMVIISAYFLFFFFHFQKIVLSGRPHASVVVVHGAMWMGLVRVTNDLFFIFRGWCIVAPV